MLCSERSSAPQKTTLSFLRNSTRTQACVENFSMRLYEDSSVEFSCPLNMPRELPS